MTMPWSVVFDLGREGGLSQQYRPGWTMALGIYLQPYGGYLRLDSNQTPSQRLRSRPQQLRTR